VAVPLIHYEIPEELHRRVKVAAAQQGITLKAAIIQSLEQWAPEESKKPKR
jgi:predicted HicB family RNase H-like nuclease